MVLSPQDKIQRATARIQHKMFDIAVRTLGSGASSTYLLEIEEDKFHNSKTVIKDYRQIFCRIVFPGNEIPIRPATEVNTSSNVLMLYDILPIEMYCLFGDNVSIGDIILYKFQAGDGGIQILPLQVVNLKVKGGVSHTLIQTYIVAPITDYNLLHNPDFLTILEKYKQIDMVW